MKHTSHEFPQPYCTLRDQTSATGLPQPVRWSAMAAAVEANEDGEIDRSKLQRSGPADDEPSEDGEIEESHPANHAQLICNDSAEAR